MSNINEYIGLGVSEKRKGNYNKALQYYMLAERIDSEDVELNVAMGKILHILERYDDALKSYAVAATVSASYINIDLFGSYPTFRNLQNIPFDNFEAIQAQQQIYSLILNVFRHCGTSCLALAMQNKPGVLKDKLGLSPRTVNNYLEIYRNTIDPLYKKPVYISQEIKEFLENESIKLGNRFLLEFAKQNNSRNLLKICNIFRT